jgi:HNH endonuclease
MFSYSTGAKAGGQATAIKLRKQALDNYYKDPNLCLYCNSIITVGDRKVSTTRKHKFCNHSCAAMFNNVHRPRKPKLIKPERVSTLPTRTKGEMFAMSANWQSARSIIQRMARQVMKASGTPSECCICQYAKQVDVCHIQAVNSFPDEALLSEINNILNLRYLCKQHHWEFDHNLLEIAFAR